MTNQIHLDKDITDLTARKLRLSAEEFFERADQLYCFIANVDWEGSSRDAFLWELYRHTSTLKSLADTLDLLGFQLSQETEVWISISARFNN